MKVKIPDSSRGLAGTEKTVALARALASTLNQAGVQPLGCTVNVVGHGLDVEIRAVISVDRHGRSPVATGKPFTWKLFYEGEK